VTCVAISHDETVFYTGGKDCVIIKWNLISHRRLLAHFGHAKQTAHNGHKDAILSLAVSKDGTLLASGSKDKAIIIWSTQEANRVVTKFEGHRDSVTGLAFRLGTHELYSASLDRSIKIWNCDTNSYVTTCFGHIDSITDLDCFRKERAVTAGLDKSIRLWKIPEQSQLVFSGAEAQECVAMLTDEYWVSGGIYGSLHLWNIRKKKPVFTLKNIHGSNSTISSIATVPYSDIIATGSGTGQIKLWRWLKSERKLQHFKDMNLPGWINQLKFSRSGNYMVAAVGRDQKLGRWLPLNVRNAVVTYNFTLGLPVNDSE